MGPLMLKVNQRAFLYPFEEVRAITEKMGFTVEQSAHEVLPYLQSQLESSLRSVLVHCWAAINSEIKDFDGLQQDDEILPDFLIDSSLPVHFAFDTAPIISSHQLVAELYQLAQQGLSLQQMTQQLSINRDSKEVEVFLRQVLLHLFRSNRTEFL